MITRKLTPREDYLIDMVNAMAFESRCNFTETKEKCLAMTDEEVEKRLHPVPKCDPPLPSELMPGDVWWGSFNDDETRLQSCLCVNNHTIQFAGEQVLMGGIGGVATLADSRRTGGIRAAMQMALEDMYENGFAFSELYPFSTEYYRQFGYEKAMKINIWTLPLEHIRPDETGGRIRQLLPGDSTEALTKVYTRFYDGWNLSVIRRHYDEEMDLEKMMNENRYVFVWEDELGSPRGFMITKKVMVDGQPVMDCTHNFGLRNAFLFLDARACRAMLTFVKKAFSSDYRAIRFQTPDCLYADNLLGEGTSCRRAGRWDGMVRVVNVAKVLQLCRCKGEGSIVLNISDNMLADNNGGWRITYAPGKPNQVERTDDAPDITMNIAEFSVLICGIACSEDLAWMPGVQVHDPSVPYEQLFYRQKCFTMDLF